MGCCVREREACLSRVLPPGTFLLCLLVALVLTVTQWSPSGGLWGPLPPLSLQRFAASAGSTAGVMIEGCGLAAIRERVLSQLHPASFMLGMLLPFSAPQFVHVSLVDFNITYIIGCVN